MAEKKNALEEQLQIKSAYEAGLALYRKGEFSQAKEAFVALHNISNDSPSKTMAERCQEYVAAPPENWLGIAVMKEK